MIYTIKYFDCATKHCKRTNNLNLYNEMLTYIFRENLFMGMGLGMAFNMHVIATASQIKALKQFQGMTPLPDDNIIHVNFK